MPIIGTLPSNIVNGDIADAPTAMANWNYIVAQVNANAAQNGANNDITALLALTTPITPAQGGSTVYYGAASTGTLDYVVASASPLGYTFTAGKRIVFIAGANNTGSNVRLNANGTGLIDVRKRGAGGLVALNQGDWVAGQLVECISDGTYHIWNENSTQGFGQQGTIPSATTTDLGTTASRNVLVSGTTTITSFGASANIAFPLYLVQFSGILQITHTGGTLNLPNGANITTAAGDTCWAFYNGSGQWTVISYMRASGRALTPTDPFPSQTGNSGKVLLTNGTSVLWGANAITAAASISSAGVVTGSYNVTSVTVVGTGIYDITLTTALNNTDFQVFAFLKDGSFVGLAIEQPGSRTTSNVRIRTTLANGVAQAFAFSFLIVGGL
jgi:hypothetical protein